MKFGRVKRQHGRSVVHVDGYRILRAGVPDLVGGARVEGIDALA